MTQGLPALFLFFLFSRFVFAATSLVATSDALASQEIVKKLLVEGELLYKTRDQADHADRAIAIYKKILEINPQQDEALWKLSRSFLWQGDRSASQQEKSTAYKKSKQYAKESISINPDGVGGHLMLGITYGRIGEVEGAWKSLFLISAIKKEIETVLNTEPRNDVAHHVLGVYYRKIPKLLGGSIEKSRMYFRKALDENPFRTRHYLELAKSVLKQGEKREAIGLLEQLLAISKPEDLVQSKYDREHANELLLKLQSN